MKRTTRYKIIRIFNISVVKQNLAGPFQDMSETQLRRAMLASRYWSGGRVLAIRYRKGGSVLASRYWSGGSVLASRYWRGGSAPNLKKLRLIIDEIRCGHKRVLANGRFPRHACACSNVAMVAMQIMWLMRSNSFVFK